MEIELERTFLLKHKPENLDKSRSCKLLDIYFVKGPKGRPVLRIRSRDGKKFEMTKKFNLNESDLSEMEEHNILLSEDEFNILAKSGSWRISKERFYYQMPNIIAEVDVFGGGLAGLVLADFEFKTREEKEKFIPPEFCSGEITQDEDLGNSILSGADYEKIDGILKKYNYKKIL